MLTRYALPRVCHGGMVVLTICLWALTPPVWAQSGKIQGSVWYDSNANGIRDVGEPPLPGRLVCLQNGLWVISRSDGSYQFSNLQPGEYTITQTPDAGWEQSFPRPEFPMADQMMWAGSLNGMGSNTIMGEALAMSPCGGFYLGGYFSGSVDLNPTAEQDLHSSMGTSAFVTFLHADGSYAWSWTAAVGEGGVTGIVANNDGVYAVGSFTNSSVNFGSSQSSDVKRGSGYRCTFITHLKANGNYGWTRVIDGDTNSDVLGKDLCLDQSGNLYVTGSFNRRVDFDPGYGTFWRETNYTPEFFVVKLGLYSGVAQWVQTTRGLGRASGIGIEFDPGQNAIVVTGQYNQWIVFRDLPERTRLQSYGDDDTFIACFSVSGVAHWIHEIKSSYTVDVHDMARDSEGNLVVTGMYTNNASFQPGGSFWYNEPAEVGQCYIAKMDRNGRYLWGKTVGSEAVGSAGTGVTVDASGRVYLVGERTGTNWDPERSHASDLFLNVYSSQGQVLASQDYHNLYPTTFTGNFEYGFIPNIWRVCSNDQGSVAMAGPFDRCVDVDPQVGTEWVCPRGQVDTFFVQLSGKSVGDSSGWSVSLEPGQTLYGVDFANYIAAR